MIFKRESNNDSLSKTLTSCSLFLNPESLTAHSFDKVNNGTWRALLKLQLFALYRKKLSIRQWYKTMTTTTCIHETRHKEHISFKTTQALAYESSVWEFLMLISFL